MVCEPAADGSELDGRQTRAEGNPPELEEEPLVVREDGARSGSPLEGGKDSANAISD